MKIGAADFERLKNKIEGFFKLHDKRHLKEQYWKTGHSETRFRWDVFWSAGCGDFLQELYARGLKDSHIDTALKKIFEGKDAA